jgi:amino acid adenylation domain-containing protein
LSRTVTGQAATVHAPEELTRFPLTDIQSAYMVGKSRLIELGGRQQYYVEFDAVGFDPGRAEEAINRLVHRHEHLRTIMGEDGDQRVLAAAGVPRVTVTVQDLSARAGPDRDAALGRTRQRMCDEGLDPAGWPLFEIVVSRIRPHRAHIHMRASLLLLDAPSIRTVVREWWTLYHDPQADLPAVPMTFRDWRLALLEEERSERYRKQWQYWEERLDTLPEAPQLPLAVQPGGIDSVRFEGRTSYLTGDQWRQFCANFRKHRVLPTTALLHVYAETLGAWSASPHFCLNVVHLSQAERHGGQQDVVGQRTATLPLEVDLRGDDGFWQRAQQLQRRLWQDMANSDVTAVRISRELAARQGWTQRAALPYVFTSNQGPGWDSMANAGQRPVFRFLGRIQHTPQVLVDDQVRDTADGGIGSNLDFVDEAFPPGLPAMVSAAYDRMLAELAVPGGAQQAPDPVPPGHRALIGQINDTFRPAAPARLEDGFLRQAAAHPGDPAVITSDRALTYAELESRSRAVARWLSGQGVGRGDVVPIVMAKGWPQVVAALGVLRSGAAYCPVDVATPARPMRDMLTECEAKVVLVEAGGAPLPDGGPTWQTLAVDSPELQPGALPELGSDAADLAYIIYTSGSTGKPKGVMIEHRGAVNTILDVNQRLSLGAGDRVFGISSLSFDLSVWDVFGTLAAGAALVIPDPSAHPEPIAWARAAAANGVTIWNSVPALAEMLVEVAEQRPEISRAPIRAFLLSGDWIPISLPDRMRLLWAQARVLALGGATEASIWSNLYEVSGVNPGWRSIPYGRPLANQTMRVLDHRLDVRPPWATGRIYIGGAGLARGYYRDQERTGERFIISPRTGERLYWTGDLGRYWPDGTIEFLGREDRQVKILGFRVEPGAIEAAARSHPAVGECVVCVDAAPGGQRRLGLLAVPRPGQDLDGQALAGHLGSLLAHYMIPGQIRVVDRLPLTPNGKVDLARALTILASSAAAQPSGTDASDDPLTERLGRLWAELLQVPTVDPDANFFALGGNSLLGLRMVNRVRAELGTDLPFGRLFEAPTVRELAGHIARGGGPGTGLVTMAEGDGPELFLFHVMGGSVAHYVPLAQAWPGPVRAFSSPALMGPADTPLPPDLKIMAAAYRGTIQRERPHGPYTLGGWSMGGYLAYEVACQLTQRGEETRILMIDSDIPQMHRDYSIAVEQHLTFLIYLSGGSPPEAAEKAIKTATPAAYAQVARDVAVAHGFLPPEVDIAEYQRLLRIFVNDASVIGTWKPDPLDAPALLLMAADEAGRPDPVPFWQAVCPGITVQTVPGDHFTIGTDERLADLARRGHRWLISQRRARRQGHQDQDSRD